jgi:hypothetical protein
VIISQELLPVISCAIEKHPDCGVRDSLTHLLFNLIKKPDEEQRRIIMGVSVLNLFYMIICILEANLITFKPASAFHISYFMQYSSAKCPACLTKYIS